MATHFARAHGLGNDYLVADPSVLPFVLTPERVKIVCHRNLGVGSDGILLLDESTSDPSLGVFGLRILNPDGSEAEKSGNGIRIFARWLYVTGRSSRPDFIVRTLGGDVPVVVQPASEGPFAVTADMGRATFREDLTSLEIDGETLAVTALSVGNPHCVVLRDPLAIDDVRRFGPLIERHPAFPQRTNVQLARVVARDRVEALIWERGAGETLASGSSACAVAAACHRLGMVDMRVTIAMPGGDLYIRIANDASLWMRGPVEGIAEITLGLDLIDRLRALP